MTSEEAEQADTYTQDTACEPGNEDIGARACAAEAGGLRAVSEELCAGDRGLDLSLQVSGSQRWFPVLGSQSRNTRTHLVGGEG